MPPLHDVLIALADRPDVSGVLIVSDEGLVIDSVVPESLETEAVAALAATGHRSLAVLSDSLGHGEPDGVVLEGQAGTAVLRQLPSGALLVVIAASEGDIGQLLFDLRRHCPALSELI